MLIVAGSLVGASGLILTFIMCKAMNRTLPDVLFKSFGGSEKQELTRTKVGSDADEVAMMADGAQKIIIVPGYGMAVSQCQHQVKEFADLMAGNRDRDIADLRPIDAGDRGREIAYFRTRGGSQEVS